MPLATVARSVPIDIDEFESSSSEELQDDGQPVREAVLEFLGYNPDQAYSRDEIQTAVNVDGIALLHALSSLEREGLVRHKGRYWAIADGRGEAGE